MNLARAARIVLIGAPGAGKGTQTARLIDRFPQFTHVSSGNLLRDNVLKRTALGIAAEARMKAGQLVPDSMILRLIVNRLEEERCIEAASKKLPYMLSATAFGAAEQPAEFDSQVDYRDEFFYPDGPAGSFILDGYPRTAEQARQIDGIVPVGMVVNIDTPAEVIIERISNRWVHERSNRVYNLTFNPPQRPGLDDVTGEPLTRRADDDPAVWKSRLASFSAAVAPLLEHYDRAGRLVTVQGNSSDEITPQLISLIEASYCGEEC